MPGDWQVQVVVSETPELEALGCDRGWDLGDGHRLERAVRETLAAEPARLSALLARLSAPAGAPSRVEVSLTVTGDAEIADLNRRYLGRDEPTDVMAFPMWEVEDGEPAAGQDDQPVAGRSFLLGDVVISADTARRQAADYGRPLAEELCRLVAHGTLHLLDYDDSTGEAAALMHAKEDQVLASLGFNPTSPASPTG